MTVDAKPAGKNRFVGYQLEHQCAAKRGHGFTRLAGAGRNEGGDAVSGASNKPAVSGDAQLLRDIYIYRGDGGAGNIRAW